MLTEGAERVCQPTGVTPVALRIAAHGSRDGVALVRLAHSGVPLPAPAVTGHFVAEIDRLAGKPGRALDGASAGVQRRDRAVLGERRRDPPPARPRSIFEMRVLTGIRIALDLFDRLVGALVPLVAVRNGKLRAFFQIDDERDRDARLVRPLNPGRIFAVASEIPPGNACHRGLPPAKAICESMSIDYCGTT